MDIRNIAIIAHVDHGKTTLVDSMLRQGGAFRVGQQVAERAMDRNDLERERGITILAKCTSVFWKDLRLNIVDTPGHADFGGEVERILGMVDGVMMLVDAAEGPLPQTKFVLSKALARGLKPMVLVNKVDRPDARPHIVHDEVFDLFAGLGADEEQLDFPTLFGSGRDGWVSSSPDEKTEDLTRLFDLVVRHVPPPTVDVAKPFRVLATLLDADPFLGRILTGRIENGTVKAGATIKALAADGKTVEQTRITKLLSFRGLDRVPVESASAGEIVAIAGFATATVADTLCDLSVTEPLQAQPVDPPTLAMTFSVNDSPLAGREGDKVTSRMLRERLLHEAEGNIAIRIRETDEKDAFEVAGRGELQLGILIETMRREGYEMSVARPRVLFKTDDASGEKLEPIEEVVVDVDEAYASAVIAKLTERKGELVEQRPAGAGKQRLRVYIPTRGLIGYQSEFQTDTRGTGIMNRLFHGYAPYKGALPMRRTGVLISNDQGEAVAYAMWQLEERGPMLIDPGVQVYAGMIIGEHSRGNDLEVNVLRGKKLTNIRAAGKDENVQLTPPLRLSLERALTYINDDELVEVTPKNIRLRKKILDPNDRKRAQRLAESA